MVPKWPDKVIHSGGKAESEASTRYWVASFMCFSNQRYCLTAIDKL